MLAQDLPPRRRRGGLGGCGHARGHGLRITVGALQAVGRGDGRSSARLPCSPCRAAQFAVKGRSIAGKLRVDVDVVPMDSDLSTSASFQLAEAARVALLDMEAEDHGAHSHGHSHGHSPRPATRARRASGTRRCACAGGKTPRRRLAADAGRPRAPRRRHAGGRPTVARGRRALPNGLACELYVPPPTVWARAATAGGGAGGGPDDAARRVRPRTPEPRPAAPRKRNPPRRLHPSARAAWVIRTAGLAGGPGQTPRVVHRRWALGRPARLSAPLPSPEGQPCPPCLAPGY